MPYDYKNIKEAAALVLPLVKIIEDVAGEQLSGFSALIKFVPLISKIGPALRDLKDVPLEYADLTDVERVELKAYVHEQLDLSDDNTEAVVEQVLDVVIDLSQLFQSLQSVRQVPVKV